MLKLINLNDPQEVKTHLLFKDCVTDEDYKQWAARMEEALHVRARRVLKQSQDIRRTINEKNRS